MKNTNVADIIEHAHRIMYALAYDTNPAAPTITAKENVIRCVVALYTRGLLNWRQKLGLWLLCDGKIRMKPKVKGQSVLSLIGIVLFLLVLSGCAITPSFTPEDWRTYAKSELGQEFQRDVDYAIKEREARETVIFLASIHKELADEMD